MSDGAGPRVVVVGAGVTGLAAGFRLREAGVDVTVLERGDRPGGRIRTERDGEHLLDIGATAISGAYRRVLALAADAGIGHRLLTAGSVVGFPRDGRIHHLDSVHLGRDMLRTKLLSPGAKLRAARLAVDLLRVRGALAGPDLAAAAKFDTETAESYARRALGDDVYEYVVDPVIRGVLTTDSALVSKVDFFVVVSNILGAALQVFDTGTQTFTDALAAGLDVRLGAEVERVRETGDGALVEWRDAGGAAHTEQADAVVVAVPGTRVTGIYPELAPAASAYLDALEYTVSVNCHVALSRPPPGLDATVLPVPRKVHNGLAGIIVDHNKAPGRAPAGRGLLSTYSTGEWSRQLIDEDDDFVVNKVIDAVEHVLPGIGGDVDFVRVHRWRDVVIQSTPGTYGRLAEFVRHRPSGRVRLAGDYFAGSSVESAAVSGETVARELAAFLARR